MSNIITHDKSVVYVIMNANALTWGAEFATLDKAQQSLKRRLEDGEIPNLRIVRVTRETTIEEILDI